KTCRRCHSERSEGPLHFQNQANAEVLRRSPRRPPQEDSLDGSSAACKAPPFQPPRMAASWVSTTKKRPAWGSGPGERRKPKTLSVLISSFSLPFSLPYVFFPPFAGVV